MADSNQTDASQTQQTYWSELSKDHGLTLDKLSRLDTAKTDKYLSALLTLSIQDLKSVNRTVGGGVEALSHARDLVELANAWCNVTYRLLHFHDGRGRPDWRQRDLEDVEDAAIALLEIVHKQTHGQEPSDDDLDLIKEKSMGFTEYSENEILKKPPPGNVLKRLTRSGDNWFKGRS